MSKSIFGLGTGTPVITGAQKVRDNNPTAPNTSFTVWWGQLTATINDDVTIFAKPDFTVTDLGAVSIKIMFGKYTMGEAKDAKLVNGVVTSKWTVQPFQAGDFTAGEYHVVVRYKGGGIMGETKHGLKIVRVKPKANKYDLGEG